MVCKFCRNYKRRNCKGLEFPLSENQTLPIIYLMSVLAGCSSGTGQCIFVLWFFLCLLQEILSKEIESCNNCLQDRIYVFLIPGVQHMLFSMFVSMMLSFIFYHFMLIIMFSLIDTLHFTQQSCISQQNTRSGHQKVDIDV